jgi:G:T-mismatch repair DNA endonuclease (very short patch repair protein)
MSHQITENKKDFTKNWVNSSKFLFYLQVFVVVAFVFGGCYNLYQHRYKGKPDVVVPDNTLYTPKYK